jgi:hypothetical protein
MNNGREKSENFRNENESLDISTVTAALKNYRSSKEWLIGLTRLLRMKLSEKFFIIMQFSTKIEFTSGTSSLFANIQSV